ncbi:MAG TPA: 50S ribosomal protein L22 [Candidatus Paceibacterota bacterium]|uniref:Large ribosomal subunit protein uL22 n=1 Tax=uncultured Parcubacteria bacterium Rifle_16ft_4_minimus_7278 TaxID=1665143 RepID=A0A0H4TV12_9BACT|nr:50S ribosomal protein L22 [uncultured Parcubacteria bacterium Rifle_16ft_4_minimus_7278]HXK34924.1 50S ribosomal protein L22 [Candidatus Paceibacterota bacterium]
MKATLTNYRQSPRKVRLITDLIKGKSVPEAENILSMLPKRGAEPVLKLLRSAAANAKQLGSDPKNLFVENATVDQGIVLKRFRPRAFGRAYQILKKTSLVKVNLSEKKTKKKSEKKVVEKK